MTLTMLNMQEFVKRHKEWDNQIRNYAWKAYGRRNLSDAALTMLKQRQAEQLHAMNAWARIELAQVARDTFTRYFADASGAEFFFLTFTPVEFAVPAKQAAAFDLDTLKAWTREHLVDIDYLAVVEAAFYSNRSLPGVRDKTISWHVHALAWNCSAEHVGRIVDNINTRHLAFLDGMPPAHVRCLKLTGAAARVVYMMKAPIEDSRVMGSRGKSRSRPMRPGDSARMCEIMGNRTVPQLLFAGGAGVALSDIALRQTVENCRLNFDLPDERRP